MEENNRMGKTRDLFKEIRDTKGTVHTKMGLIKEISPGCSLEGMMLKLKLQYFGHLMRRADSLEKTLMLGGIRGRRRRGRQLARTGASQGFPRAAAPVGVFSRGTTRISGGPSLHEMFPWYL